jgi:hypothetical protein
MSAKKLNESSSSNQILVFCSSKWLNPVMKSIKPKEYNDAGAHISLNGEGIRGAHLEDMCNMYRKTRLR